MQEAELAMLRRIGASYRILGVQNNLANTYVDLGRLEPALRLKRDVYSAHLKIDGNHHTETLRAANNYVVGLYTLKRFEEAKSLLRKSVPVARRVLGNNNALTLRMRWIYAQSLCRADGATLDDVREAVTTLEDAGRIARRVFGGTHPLASAIERGLRSARDGLVAREGGRDVSSVCDGVAAMTPGDA